MERARAALPVKILNWYLKNKRDLPWRHTHDPYVIWLSEIILQQTRVEQGMPYFYRFLNAYPDVRAFAAATEDDILTLWQGLGYYSRGRNMLKTARQVVDEFGGIFPVKYDDLIRLKGIGSYTAAAISSFSADEPHAVVDGNVYRVLARFFGVEWPPDSQKGKKEIAVLADAMLNRKQPGQHNQAMIEFGALLCKPRNPDCLFCPVNDSCYAFAHGKTAVLPAKKQKKALRERFFHVFLIGDETRVLLMRRDERDIWAGLYQPFMIEMDREADLPAVLDHPGIQFLRAGPVELRTSYEPLVHLLSHQRLFIHFHQVICREKMPDIPEPYFEVPVVKLPEYAMPQPIFTKVK